MESKVCASCGRAMEWRRAWARDWTERKYCSAACQRRKVRPVDRALEDAIRELLDQRARSASICPSEAARLVQPEDWRALLEPARRAARRLVDRGEVEITQGGRVVDPSHARGPIRIRRVHRA